MRENSEAAGLLRPEPTPVTDTSNPASKPDAKRECEAVQDVPNELSELPTTENEADMNDVEELAWSDEDHEEPYDEEWDDDFEPESDNALPSGPKP